MLRTCLAAWVNEDFVVLHVLFLRTGANREPAEGQTGGMHRCTQGLKHGQ
jgi:hypothetical protein